MHLAEKAAWCTGAALLATYMSIHYWSLRASDAGVLAVERSRACARDASQCPAVPFAVSAEKDGAGSTAAVVAPDTATWSKNRISAYRQATLHNQAPDAVLRIPSLRLVVPVFDGTSGWNLNRGVGRIDGTARFGSPGNIGIAGHRDGFFRPLRNVRVGDRLYVDTTVATAQYRVVDTRVVAPEDVGVLDPTLTPALTLVTCYPFYYAGPAPQRFIVRAELVTDRPSS